MIEIDGSFGEGGGQILRTAISLSCILKEPIRIFNIRKGRPQPGLKAQHLTGIKVAAEFCDANVNGLFIGSTEIEFYPKDLKIENKKIDIGTAGSISLLLQTLLPILIFSRKEATIDIIGGTSGLGSPNIEYTKYVFLKNLEKMGINFDLQIIKQGFFPKGGGRVILKVNPISKLKPLIAKEKKQLKNATCLTILSRLPRSFGEKFEFHLRKNLSIDFNFKLSYDNTLSPGFSSTLICDYEDYFAGFDVYYEKNKNEDYFARKIVERFKNYESSQACIDKYMADQILIYLALANGKSEITFEEKTQHFLTNVEVIKKFLNVDFKIEGNKLEVEGKGLM